MTYFFPLASSNDKIKVDLDNADEGKQDVEEVNVLMKN